MGFWDIFSNKKAEPVELPAGTKVELIPADAPKEEPKAYYAGWGGTASTYPYGYGISIPFDGEKQLGGLGPVINYVNDHDRLRMRSRQMYLTNDICNTLISRKNTWLIGAGLTLQCNPDLTVLEQEGIVLDKDFAENFNKQTEARFKVWGREKTADWNGRKTFPELQKECNVQKMICGDILVILRYKNRRLMVQHIDGENVATPPTFTLEMNESLDSNNGYDYINPDTKNRVRKGVEIDGHGEPVAYWVRIDANLDYARVPAKNSLGVDMAFMVEGQLFRVDDTRGIPAITSNMENASMLDKYKQAIVGSAVERERIPYFFEHELGAIGQGALPGIAAVAKTYGPTVAADTDLPRTFTGQQLADKVAASTNKMVFDLNPGTRVNKMEHAVDANFAAFFNANIDSECATFGMPPEVVMMKYGGSFSSSRAGLKDLEHSLIVDRVMLSAQYQQKVYNAWLHYQILEGKINAPGYLNAWAKGNFMVVSAYRNCTWEGPNVPHIDPLKEVNAERAKLGILADHIPLTTLEAATRVLNGGDYASNAAQFSRELELAEDLDLEAPEEEAKEPVDNETGKVGQGAQM